MNYRALALDLDGTLTDSNKNLPKENKAAIWKAIDKGCAVILASGRPVLGIAELANELELDKRGGYVLAYNGGNIIDWKTGELMYEKMMPSECIHEICSQAAANDVVALTYTIDEIVTENDTDEYVLKEVKCNNAPLKKVDNLEAFVDYPVSKFLVVGEHKKLLPVQEALLKRHGDVLDAFFRRNIFWRLFLRGLKSRHHLRVFLKSLGLTEQS